MLILARPRSRINQNSHVNCRAFPKWNARPKTVQTGFENSLQTYTNAHTPALLPYTGNTMTSSRSALALCLATYLVLPLHAQTATSPHHTGTTAHRATSSALNPADHPPGVPPVRGIPKPLYALRYVDVLVGTGPLAEQRKFYTVRYTGWTTDGKKFDSSDDHPGKEPITFAYGAHRVIAGWDTGFQGMHVGGKRRLFVPYQLAYGDLGRPPVIPAKADLIFDIELVAQTDTPPTPPTPPGAKPAPAASPEPPQPGSTPAPAAPPSGQPTDPTKPTTSPTPGSIPPATH